MIGLAPRGRVRPWMIAAAITALQRAFPWGEVSHEQFWGLSSHVFILRGSGCTARLGGVPRALRRRGGHRGEARAGGGTDGAPGESGILAGAHLTDNRGARDPMSAALEASILEHEYCGELDSAVDDGRVWMTCT
jgi:hypothetical protein